MDIKLTNQHIIDAANYIGIEPAVLKAVAMVESLGGGFLPSGKCKILFEGHIFWRQLVIAGVNPKIFARNNPGVLYENWDKTKYVGGEGEYNRLEVAKVIHKEAALKSASWGMFQIMGFNFNKCGFKSVFEFTESMQQSEFNHLQAAVKFIVTSGMLQCLKDKDWEGFARRYNGPGYAQNNYDKKLQGAYNVSLSLNK